MAEIRKMTNKELVYKSSAADGFGNRLAAINELARRLEAAEAKAATYWAECEAWRKWHDDESDRGTGWMMELVTNVDKARATTDAAREVRSE